MRIAFLGSAAAAALAASLLSGCGGGESGDAGGGDSRPVITDPVHTDPGDTDPPLTRPSDPQPTPTPEKNEDDPVIVGQVPDRLVGEWDGDGEGSARLDKITFFADGNVRLLYNNRQVLEGPAVVEDSRMTLYVPGGPIVYESWYIDRIDAGYGYLFDSLMLDGVSYVQQVN
ncbi:hypothetical protein [Streptomyces sp. NPDC054834]